MGVYFLYHDFTEFPLPIVSCAERQKVSLASLSENRECSFPWVAGVLTGENTVASSTQKFYNYPIT